MTDTFKEIYSSVYSAKHLAVENQKTLDIACFKYFHEYASPS